MKSHCCGRSPPAAAGGLRGAAASPTIGATVEARPLRVAHFDCFSGISGDMVLGAVIAAGVSPDPIRAALDSLGLPIKLEVEAVKRCGFAATKATVEAADQEEYRFLPDVEAILARGNLTGRQRALATAIFRKLAHAEAAAHGMPLEQVHFHEVGALDSIAEVDALQRDRKSTRLNSSHVEISYAVFCLKKKKD